MEKLNGKWWSVDYPLTIVLELDVGVLKMTLGKGFITDFGSIPRFAQGWIDKEGDNLIAFLVHDAGYVYRGFSRLTWDSIMEQILEIKGMSRFKRLVVYNAVRIGGSSYFYKDVTEIPELNKTLNKRKESKLLKVEWLDKL